MKAVVQPLSLYLCGKIDRHKAWYFIHVSLSEGHWPFNACLTGFIWQSALLPKILFIRVIMCDRLRKCVWGRMYGWSKRDRKSSSCELARWACLILQPKRVPLPSSCAGIGLKIIDEQKASSIRRYVTLLAVAAALKLPKATKRSEAIPILTLSVSVYRTLCVRILFSNTNSESCGRV